MTGPDPILEYLRVHRIYQAADEELGRVEARYEAAVDEQHTVFLAVARMTPCAECDQPAHAPCLFETGLLSPPKAPAMSRVHNGRDEAARRRLKNLGVFP